MRKKALKGFVWNSEIGLLVDQIRMFLPGTEITVAKITKTGNDELSFVKLFIQRCHDDFDLRKLVIEQNKSFRSYADGGNNDILLFYAFGFQHRDHHF